MRYLLSLFVLSLLLQGGSQSVNIPVSIPSFELGYGASNSQTLNATPAQLQADPNHLGYFIDGIYTLQFDAENTFGPYPGYYIMQITFGTQELCDGEGWGTRTFSHVTIVCPSSAYIVADQALPGGGLVQGASNLVLKFTVNDGSFNGGWPIQFRNISLIFTPN